MGHIESSNTFQNGGTSLTSSQETSGQEQLNAENLTNSMAELMETDSFTYLNKADELEAQAQQIDDSNKNGKSAHKTAQAQELRAEAQDYRNQADTSLDQIESGAQDILAQELKNNNFEFMKEAQALDDQADEIDASNTKKKDPHKTAQAQELRDEAQAFRDQAEHSLDSTDASVETMLNQLTIDDSFEYGMEAESLLEEADKVNASNKKGKDSFKTARALDLQDDAAGFTAQAEITIEQFDAGVTNTLVQHFANDGYELSEEAETRLENADQVDRSNKKGKAHKTAEAQELRNEALEFVAQGSESVIAGYELLGEVDSLREEAGELREEAGALIVEEELGFNPEME